MPVPCYTYVADAAVVPADADAVIFVLTSKAAPHASSAVQSALAAASGVDASFWSAPTVVPVDGQRVIFAYTGPLNRDCDDARRISTCVTAAVTRAKKAGASKPFLVLPGAIDVPGFEKATLIGLIAALGALYVPLSVRVSKGEETVEPITTIYFTAVGTPAAEAETLAGQAYAIELGKRVARDIGGADPEAGCPLLLAAYITKTFAGVEGVTVSVEADPAVIAAEYPCAAAVARCSLQVPRHIPTIVRLEYTGAGPITAQHYFVGKGVVFDTGGADLKTGGAMVNMSRDKCGAATVAGLIRTAAQLRTPGTRIVGYLGFVRNSIGADAFVCDEIITARSGKKVMIVNTDAEGRLVMVDLLCKAKEEVAAQPLATRPTTSIHTIATLTGHAVIAVGLGISIAVDNGPARRAKLGPTFKAAGELIADPVEVSTLRTEDFDFVAPKTSEYDVYQCNSAPSSQTPRGHMFPAAMMINGSGLDAHGIDSVDPIAYQHIDIAGASVAAPYSNGVTTGQPVAALAATLCRLF